MMQHLPVMETWLHQIAQLQEVDETCKQIRQHCLQGWPEKHHVQGPIAAYLFVSGVLTVQGSLLMNESRIVFPAQVRKDILDQLHTGHQSITKASPNVMNEPDRLVVVWYWEAIGGSCP